MNDHSKTSRPVWNDFRQRPWRYDFWKALALTRKLHPGRRVRFKVPPRMKFSPGPVADLKVSPDGTPALILNLTGLAGPESPLPLWQTELAGGLELRGDPALAEFFNLFNDRVLDLYQELMGRMKPEAAPDGHALDQYFLAAAGVLTDGIRGQTVSIPTSGPHGDQPGELPEASFLSAAQVWGMFPRSASGLEFLVEKVFGVKAKVEPLKGAWMPLPDEHRTRLGRDKNQLGRDAISGGHVFDPAAGFALKLESLTLEQYRSFLPPLAGNKAMMAIGLVRWYCNNTSFIFDLSSNF
jgi:type VI secretion system protein ImpH